MPSMQRSHSLYSAGSHLCIVLDTVEPSRMCKRSLTNTVLCFLTPRSALTVTNCCIIPAFGAAALSRSSDFPLFAANFLVEGLILSQKDPYFCEPGQSTGSSSTLPSSANSSARSFIKHPVWLLTFTRLMLPVHCRSLITRGQITSKCTI